MGTATADPLTYLRQRLTDDWLIGASSLEFTELTQQRLQELKLNTISGTQPSILLTETSPARFLAGLIAACGTGCPVFLGNSRWAEAEWQQALDLAQPDVIWGAQPLGAASTNRSGPAVAAQPGWIMIPTGGSSGQVRFAIHTWETLMAAVEGFRQHFQVEQVNSCCVLPLYHVSGLMQAMRSFTSGGQLAIAPSKTLEAGILPVVNPANWFLSLVPTQLQRLLDQPHLAGWLPRVQTILLGGAPAWPQLLADARQRRLRLAPTYGMTETAAQIATLQPDDFLRGVQGCGSLLPHAQIEIRPQGLETMTGSPSLGRIVVRAESLYLGYFARQHVASQSLATDDLGYLDEQGHLHLVGRSSDKIISGGENIFPAEVEAAIRATGLVADVAVVGLPDRQWGEVVVAVYVPEESIQPTAAELKAALQDSLSPYKQPKRWVGVEGLPRSPQGKLNRIQLRQLAALAAGD